MPSETTQLREVDTAPIAVDGAVHDGSAGEDALFVANSVRADFSDCDERGKLLTAANI